MVWGGGIGAVVGYFFGMRRGDRVGELEIWGGEGDMISNQQQAVLAKTVLHNLVGTAYC